MDRLDHSTKGEVVECRSHLRITGEKGDITLVSAWCPTCHKPDLLEIPAEGFTAWLAGALIQDALPSLNDTQREQLITGYCQTCWDEMWAEPEDEGENWEGEDHMFPEVRALRDEEEKA